MVKGDEVRISVQEGAIRIEPKQPTKVETISEGAIEAYSKALKGIQAKVTMDSEALAIHLEFSGENEEVVDLFVRNLWRNLPIFFSLLGVGSTKKLLEETPVHELRGNGNPA